MHYSQNYASTIHTSSLTNATSKKKQPDNDTNACRTLPLLQLGSALWLRFCGYTSGGCPAMGAENGNVFHDSLTHNSPTCITLQFAASEAAWRWVRTLVSSIVASSINAAARNLLSCIGVYCALRKDVELYIHTSSSCSSLLRFFDVCWYLQWRM